ncbi:MAG: thymidine kinase [Candidatus Nanopelagicales bacterium]
MAELVFFSGTMDCGKSTLALQTDHNHATRGRRGAVFTQFDRAGTAVLSSRLGLQVEAIEVDESFSFREFVVAALSGGQGLDYLICDEAQFYTVAQVHDLAELVDRLGVDVYAFGIATDFKTRLFPGSARLIELADRVEVLQVASLCWCGQRGTHNARTVGGVMVTEGDQVMVGDTDAGVVAYEVLCRDHHRREITAAKSGAEHVSMDPLPFAQE